MEPSAHTVSQPLLSRKQLNSVALEKWLTDHIAGFEGPVEMRLFKRDQSNPTYQLNTPSRTYVLRSKPAPAIKLLPSSHAIEREYLVMQKLSTVGYPVPRMLAICEDESIIGRAFYVMEYVAGQVMWDPSLPGMNKSMRQGIYTSMNSNLAKLHNLDYTQLGLTQLGPAENYFMRQINRWTNQYKASATQSIAEMESLIKWLPEHIPSNDNNKSTCIVHGDYRLDNMVFAHSQHHILAVLDWELVSLGHPLADFSYHCMTWHIPPGIFRGIAGLNFPQLGIPTEEQYIALYASHRGLSSTTEITQNWNFYMAYNFFRVAAILQGIAKRVGTGMSVSATAFTSAAGVVPMAKLAWRFAQAHAAP